MRYVVRVLVKPGEDRAPVLTPGKLGYLLQRGGASVQPSDTRVQFAGWRYHVIVCDGCHADDKGQPVEATSREDLGAILLAGHGILAGSDVAPDEDTITRARWARDGDRDHCFSHRDTGIHRRVAVIGEDSI